MSLIYATHPRYADHDMRGYQHPEHSGRIKAVWKQMEAGNLLDRLTTITPAPATDEQLRRVHSAPHLEILHRVAQQNQMSMLDADTYALPQSVEIARLAAGAAIAAVNAVCTREADYGLAAVRPPGHHATPNKAMGFCLLNNIAIAARHAQAAHDIERVMIVDFDVHHGNGTQDTFYDDDSVFFLSSHQHPFYPGTGAAEDTGTGAGKGYTLNIPLSAGVGDEGYAAVYEQIVWKAAQRFQPQLLLVSAGYDAHFVDPLARMQLSLAGYAHLCRELKQIADELCEGRIVFVMEGGYDLQAIGHGIRNIAHVLLDDETISDPYGTPDSTRETDVASVIAQVQSLHNL